jgi:hypothetical protein
MKFLSVTTAVMAVDVINNKAAAAAITATVCSLASVSDTV